MEARQTLRGSAIPKALLIVLAMCAAVILAVAVSFISRDLTGSGSTSTTVHPAPYTVLRQDYQGPSSAPSSAPLLDRGAEQQPSQRAITRHNSVEDVPGFRD
jgi:hypothetical protein